MAAVMPVAVVDGDARSGGAGGERGGHAGNSGGPRDIDSGRCAEHDGDPADLLVVARVYCELVARANAVPPPSARA